MHQILPRPLTLLLACALQTAAPAATTVISDLDAHLPTSWSNGLPAPGNPGTITTDTRVGDNPDDFGSNQTNWSGAIHQTSGTLYSSSEITSQGPLDYHISGGTLKAGFVSKTALAYFYPEIDLSAVPGGPIHLTISGTGNVTAQQTIDTITLSGGSITDPDIIFLSVQSALTMTGGLIQSRSITLQQYSPAPSLLSGGIIQTLPNPGWVTGISFEGDFRLGGTATIEIINPNSPANLNILTGSHLDIQPDWTGSITVGGNNGNTPGVVPANVSHLFGTYEFTYQGRLLHPNPADPDYWGNNFRLTTTPTGTQTLRLLNPIPEPTATGLLILAALATTSRRRYPQRSADLQSAPATPAPSSQAHRPPTSDL